MNPHRAAIQARLDEVGGPDLPERGRALLARLLTNYAAKTPPAIDRLADALTAGQTDDVRDQAHALKGSATNVGVTALAALFGELEDEARAGRLPASPETLDRARALLAEITPLCLHMAAEISPPTE